MFGRSGFRAFKSPNWRFGQFYTPRWIHLAAKRPTPRKFAGPGWSVFQDLQLVSFGSHLIFFMLLPPIIQEYTTRIDVRRDELPPEVSLAEYDSLVSYMKHQRPMERISFLQPGLLANIKPQPLSIAQQIELPVPSTPDELTDCIGVPVYLDHCNLAVPKETEELPSLLSRAFDNRDSSSVGRSTVYKMQPYSVGHRSDVANINRQLDTNYNDLVNSKQNKEQYVQQLVRIVDEFVSHTRDYETESNQVFKAVFTQLYDLELYSLAQVLLETMVATPVDKKQRALKRARKNHLAMTKKFLKSKAGGVRVSREKAEMKQKLSKHSLEMYNHGWVKSVVGDSGVFERVVNLWCRLETDPGSVLQSFMDLLHKHESGTAELAQLYKVLVKAGRVDLARQLAQKSPQETLA
ncbi:hypothetical protein OGAPHI_002989 [Ogataea philodendri]|uniref:Uncharacterized protein n=1 Tax=Ogataea philodendri TaxID=1378263 RepID=A0A9P8T6Q3_9ASCO|nr:uncharacterized protein OGAPHI_002989 [Ogataea philodendri]KAH3667340.1 hypothetical protein OGAPHI_002989 [Ogataea philodendri]